MNTFIATGTFLFGIYTMIAIMLMGMMPEEQSEDYVRLPSPPPVLSVPAPLAAREDRLWGQCFDGGGLAVTVPECFPTTGNNTEAPAWMLETLGLERTSPPSRRNKELAARTFDSATYRGATKSE
nr:hypothetical protein B0A51_14312 [Rachicladosporium sp. CCFEE 5018]OQO21061.1 hypothetical protein B0A51_11468 [Rachicladosporium sp. CCFEE 5018]